MTAVLGPVDTGYDSKVESSAWGPGQSRVGGFFRHPWKPVLGPRDRIQGASNLTRIIHRGARRDHRAMIEKSLAKLAQNDRCWHTVKTKRARISP